MDSARWVDPDENHAKKGYLFSDLVPLIYSPELEIKETTDTASSALILDLFLEFDIHGHLSTRIYEKRDDFNFLKLSISLTLVAIYQLHLYIYGIYIIYLIRHSRACSSYSDFVKRHQCLSRKLMNRGYLCQWTSLPFSIKLHRKVQRPCW